MSMPPYAPGNIGPAPKRRKVWPVVFAVAAVLLLCGVGSAIALGGEVTPTAGSVVGTAGASAAVEAAPAAKPVAPKATKVAPKPVELTSGTWAVPSEVKPGTYVTTVEGFHCYWARLSGLDGDLGDIRADENLWEGDRGRITVRASDKGLKLTGDCVWRPVK